MWNLSFEPPEVIEARVLARLPESLRKPERSAWADADEPGRAVGSCPEGP